MALLELSQVEDQDNTTGSFCHRLSSSKGVNMPGTAFFFSFLSSFFFALFLADLEDFFPSSPFNSFNILTFSSAAVSGSSSPKSSFPPKRETILERKDGFFSPSCESAASLGFFSFFSWASFSWLSLVWLRTHHLSALTGLRYHIWPFGQVWREERPC